MNYEKNSIRYVQGGAVIERIRFLLGNFTRSSCQPTARLERARTTLVVIDTMVFAYALLRVEDHHEQAIAVKGAECGLHNS